MANELVWMPQYWPIPPLGKVYSYHYVAIDDSMPDLRADFVFDPATSSTLYVDFEADGKYKDTWYLQYKEGFGWAEWRDDYPGKKIVFSEPIGWGNVEMIGHTYKNQPKADFFKSWPPQIMSGDQTVFFEELLPEFTLTNGDKYNDVLVIVYQQSWGVGSQQAGARYWLAKGYGPIAQQWIAPKKDTGEIVITARMDGKLTIKDGYATDYKTT